jgi:hypothetical protein
VGWDFAQYARILAAAKAEPPRRKAASRECVLDHDELPALAANAISPHQTRCVVVGLRQHHGTAVGRQQQAIFGL